MGSGATVSRRAVLGSGLALPALAPVGQAEAASRSADLHWLGDAPLAVAAGAVWGAPWPRGTLAKAAPLRAVAEDGTAVPLQTWPLAYWPDGSVKWTGHAIAGPGPAGPFRIERGKPAAPARPVTVREAPDLVEITAGDLVCRLPRSGRSLIAQVLVRGRETLRDGRLVCLSRDAPPGESGTVTTETFDSVVEAVTVEQRGPVRAVVRLDGRHRSAAGRAWLPFTVRVAVDAAGGLKLTHSFVFDGDAAHDFIAGLGLRFAAPLTDELHNRHVRFAGQDGGLWGEAVRNLPGWQPAKFALANRFADQLEGRAVPALSEMDAKTRDQLLTVPAWDGFRLFQGDCDAFTIDKRTGADSSWLRADQGGRAAGLAYVGGVSGGVAFGLRHFWQ
ncbi:MAG: Tat pathway signal sequence domain protein, partial [Asticcacaulis sp.]|nr:Tat pathway signal sequence domain protein [Asticcacaulis sp.]